MISLITKRSKQVLYFQQREIHFGGYMFFSGLGEAFCFQMLLKQVFISGLVSYEEKKS